MLDPLLRLRLLGAQAVEGPEGLADGPVVRAQAFSLLARLAVGSRGGVPRDRLVALFWPDSPAERGRHALSNLLYQVRKGLGKSAVENLGDIVRLRPDAWTVDHWVFTAAVAEENHETAVEAYRGPFLDGIRVSGAAVEKWIDAERQRLHHDYVMALESLAQGAARANDARAAVSWWRRAVGADPLHSGRTTELMVWLARSGNPAAALRESLRHSDLRRAELGLPPDPAVEAAADAIKRGEIPATESDSSVADRGAPS